MTRGWKRRVVEVAEGFVPQVYISRFLWGGDWYGLGWSSGNIYLYKSTLAQLERCSYPTKEEAEQVLSKYKAIQASLRITEFLIILIFMFIVGITLG